MGRITLGEIVSDYINDKKNDLKNYGIKSFAEKCNLSRSFIHKLVDGQYTDNRFSAKVIDSVSTAMEIEQSLLMYILESDDGKEYYYSRKKYINSFNELMKKSSNDELEVYLNLIRSVEDKI